VRTRDVERLGLLLDYGGALQVSVEKGTHGLSWTGLNERKSEEEELLARVNGSRRQTRNANLFRGQADRVQRAHVIGG